MMLLGLFFNYSVELCHAQNKMNGPKTKKNNIHFENYGGGESDFFSLYQRWVSPVRGNIKCPMFPSCSQYTKTSYQVLPVYLAFPKSFERILRCGHELHLYPEIKINNHIRWYDPVVIKKLERDYETPVNIP